LAKAVHRALRHRVDADTLRQLARRAHAVAEHAARHATKRAACKASEAATECAFQAMVFTACDGARQRAGNSTNAAADKGLEECVAHRARKRNADFRQRSVDACSVEASEH
jgi:hypothetical protein